jgi:hypothetical protein
MAGKLPVSLMAGKPPVRVADLVCRSPNSWDGVGAVAEGPSAGSDLGSTAVGFLAK